MKMFILNLLTHSLSHFNKTSFCLNFKLENKKGQLHSLSIYCKTNNFRDDSET